MQVSDFESGSIQIKLDFDVVSSVEYLLKKNEETTTYPYWIPPEAITSDPPSISSDPPTPKYDVYSYSFILWELLSGLPPYVHEFAHNKWDTEEFLGAVKAGLRPSMNHGQTDGEPDRSEMSLLRADSFIQLEGMDDDGMKDFYAILASCWQDSPKDRPDFTEIVNRIVRLRKQKFGTVDKLPVLGQQEAPRDSFPKPSPPPIGNLPQDLSDKVYEWPKWSLLDLTVYRCVPNLFCCTDKLKLDKYSTYAQCMVTVIPGKEVWAGCENGKIIVYDVKVATAFCILTFPVPSGKHVQGKRVLHLLGAHVKRVNDLLLVGDCIWSCSDDMKIRVWNKKVSTIFCY